MSKFSSAKAARLNELLRQVLEIFVEMRRLTENQTDLIAAEDIAALDESIGRRQTLIEEINGLHQESDILMQSYMSYSTSTDGESISEIDAAAGQLRDAITECAGINDKNTLSAMEKAAKYAERIDKLSKSRKSLGSYIHRLSNDPELFDKMT